MGPGAIVTVSVGVCSRQPPVAPEDLIGPADAALYRAKETGRDRVVCAR
jgi:PleD family two-component response regulator